MKVVASFQDCYKWEQGYLTADLNFKNVQHFMLVL